MPGALRNREPIGVDVLQPAWWSGDDGGTDIGRGFAITLGKTRLGQQGFRGEMLRRYGPRCAFTGPQPPEVLEAAHVRSYSASHRHERSNGLLLRRDLHALFDRGLITIDPGTWTIDEHAAKREPVGAQYPPCDPTTDARHISAT